MPCKSLQSFNRHINHAQVLQLPMMMASMVHIGQMGDLFHIDQQLSVM
jgi:hypothetical protein